MAPTAKHMHLNYRFSASRSLGLAKLPFVTGNAFECAHTQPNRVKKSAHTRIHARDETLRNVTRLGMETALNTGDSRSPDIEGIELCENIKIISL